MKLEHFLIPYTKINSKWNEHQNVTLKTVKFLQENRGSVLFDISLNNMFLDLVISGKGNKRKNKQMGLHQTKELLHSEEKHQENEKAVY